MHSVCIAGLNAWRGTMCYRLPAGSGRAGMVVVVALVRVCRFSSGCVAGGQSVVVWSCRLWGDQIFGYLSRCAGAGGSRSAGLVWSLLVPGARCLVWVGLLPSGHLGVALALVLPGRLDLLSLVVRAGLVLWFSALVPGMVLAVARSLPGAPFSLRFSLPAPLVWWFRPAVSLLVSPGGTWSTLAIDAPRRSGETAGNALRICRERAGDCPASVSGSVGTRLILRGSGGFRAFLVPMWWDSSFVWVETLCRRAVDVVETWVKRSGMRPGTPGKSFQIWWQRGGNAPGIWWGTWLKRCREGPEIGRGGCPCVFYGCLSRRSRLSSSFFLLTPLRHALWIWWNASRNVSEIR